LSDVFKYFFIITRQWKSAIPHRMQKALKLVSMAVRRKSKQCLTEHLAFKCSSRR